MLAPRELPPDFKAWNRRWHAPFGRRRFLPRSLRNSWLDIKYRGPFSCQTNNATRVFEYPWAAAEINKLGKHLDILEVGGGLSGLQFTLASQGHQVTNVDPGLEAEGVGFELPTGTHRRMCSIFGAPVRLISTTIQAAKLPDQSFDVILSLSALEHFSPADVCGFAHEVKRLLRPQGRLIMTADLFIDVQPFCSQPSNKWGTNINLKSFLEMAQLQLLLGNRAELCGFDEFKADAILGNSSNYLLVPPSFVQCVIAGR